MRSLSRQMPSSSHNQQGCSESANQDDSPARSREAIKVMGHLRFGAYFGA